MRLAHTKYVHQELQEHLHLRMIWPQQNEHFETTFHPRSCVCLCDTPYPRDPTQRHCADGAFKNILKMKMNMWQFLCPAHVYLSTKITPLECTHCGEMFVKTRYVLENIFFQINKIDQKLTLLLAFAEVSES